MNKIKYKVGIIIPCYNRRLEHLDNLVEFKDIIKIYYIDDCSDAQYYLYNVEKLADLGIDYQSDRFNKNKGALKARNYMTSKVNDCEYVMYLDSDDALDSNEFKDVINNLKISTDVLAFGSIRNNKLYKALDHNKRMMCTGYTCKLVRTKVAKRTIKMCKGYIHGFGEDIEFTYWLGYVTTSWVTLSSNYAYRVNISMSGITNSVYHNETNMYASIKELTKAVNNKKIPNRLRKCYLLCMNNILNGYIKYSNDPAVQKIEPIEIENK